MTDLSLDDLTRPGPQRLTVDVLAGPRSRLRKEAIVRSIFFVAGTVAAIISVLILLSLIREAWTFITEVRWTDEVRVDPVTGAETVIAEGQIFGQSGWFPRRGSYHVKTLLSASIIVTGVAMLVAGPLGLGSAIYLSEYASRRTRSVLKPVLEILAGVPSVVLGFFALFFISPELVEKIGRNAWLWIGTVILAIIVISGSMYLSRTIGGAGRFSVLSLGGAAAVIGILAGLFFASPETLAGWSWVTWLLVGLAAFAVLAGAYLARTSEASFGPLMTFAFLVGMVLLIAWWVPEVASSEDLFKVKRSGQLAAASIGVGILTIPLVASVAEDALAAVPRELREASAGLGAKKATTTTQVVLPAAVSGIVAAFIIGISRALGETMVVFMAGGAADAAQYTASPFDGGLTMTAGMASLATGTDNVVGEGLTFQSLYFVGFVLFILTLILNVVAGRFVARVRERY